MSRISDEQIDRLLLLVQKNIDDIDGLSDIYSSIGHTHTSTTTSLNRKLIDIGDWNMDSTGTLNVAHGLTYTKIRGVFGVIRDDAGTNYYPLTTGYDIASSMDASIYAFDTTNIKLTRKASGFFDSVNFDSTSYNRGWITVEYVD
jgi:hypothetical protein